MEPLPRQVIPVRVRHLETPNSYLRRLCVANSIDFEWLVRQLRQRNLGEAIAQLGGPEPGWFEAAHASALVGYPNFYGPWDKQPTARMACRWCTAGEPVLTYPHVRTSFCRRHGTWLGDGTRQQRQGVLDSELWKSESRLRRMVSRCLVDHHIIEMTWALVRDQHFLVSRATWDEKLQRALERPDFVREVDDRLALFPETVRVLESVAHPNFVLDVRAGVYDTSIARRHLIEVCEHRARLSPSAVRNAADRRSCPKGH